MAFRHRYQTGVIAQLKWMSFPISNLMRLTRDSTGLWSRTGHIRSSRRHIVSRPFRSEGRCDHDANMHHQILRPNFVTDLVFLDQLMQLLDGLP
jgi:hypothetical protein